jgi:hypothetical protein
MKEKCIRCGRKTGYDVSTPVTVRWYYIEGSGQLCEDCFSQLYESSYRLQNKAISEETKTLKQTDNNKE